MNVVEPIEPGREDTYDTDDEKSFTNRRHDSPKAQTLAPRRWRLRLDVPGGLIGIRPI